MRSIFDLALHEKLSIGKGVDVLRVVGGWIYIIQSYWADGQDGPTSSVFVPEGLAPIMAPPYVPFDDSDMTLRQ